MSARIVTVSDLIAELQRLPQDMPVVCNSYFDPDEPWEGCWDGPDVRVRNAYEVRNGWLPWEHFGGGDTAVRDKVVLITT